MIRLATFQDIPQLQQLIALSARGLSTAYYTPAQIESAIRYVFGIDTQLIVDGTYYVFEKAHVPVGCGGWSKRNTLYSAMDLQRLSWAQPCRECLYTRQWDTFQ